MILFEKPQGTVYQEGSRLETIPEWIWKKIAEEYPEGTPITADIINKIMKEETDHDE